MDQDIRDALTEICDVLKKKINWDMVRRGEGETVDEAKRLSARVDEIIGKLKDK